MGAVNDTEVLQSLISQVKGVSTVTTTPLPKVEPTQTPFASPAQPGLSRKMTESQGKFIRSLLSDRAGVPAAEAVRSELNAASPEGVTTKMASAFIDRLKAIPKAEVPVATKAPVRERTKKYATTCEMCGRWVETGEGILARDDDDSAWVVYHRDGECITEFPFPEGRYAADSEAGETAFYHCHGGDVFVMASDNEIRLRHDAAQTVIAKIAEDSLAAAIRYGIEFGRCGVCHRGLTDAKSRAAGIGPVCASKGWG